MPCLRLWDTLIRSAKILQLLVINKNPWRRPEAPHQQKTLNKNSNENNKKTQFTIRCFIN